MAKADRKQKEPTQGFFRLALHLEDWREEEESKENQYRSENYHDGFVSFGSHNVHSHLSEMGDSCEPHVIHPYVAEVHNSYAS